MPGTPKTRLTPKYLEHGTLLSRHWNDAWIALVTRVEADKGFAICGAKKSQARGADEHELSEDDVCRQRAGYRTDHVGDGRCATHGGNKPITHGNTSLLRHRKLQAKVADFMEEPKLLDLRSAIAVAWGLIDELLDEDATITPDRMVDVMQALSRIGNLTKQHHDITEGQRIVIEVPQFMQWAEYLYELAARYIENAGGDVVGFLTEAEAYFGNTAGSVIQRSPALGAGRVVEVA